jgi:putative tricarboxylic transport membrane protein
MTKDRALCLALILLVGVMFAETFNFPEKSDWQMYSPAFYPRIILTIIGILTMVLSIRSFKLAKQSTESNGNDAKQSFWKEYGNIILLFVVFGIYAVLLPQIGFIMASILYLFASQAILMGIGKKPLILNSTVSLVATLAVYFIFTNILGVWLP